MMDIIIRPIEHLYRPEEAKRVAAQLNSCPDDDFTYEVVHDPRGIGLSFIKVIDEDGVYIAKF